MSSMTIFISCMYFITLLKGIVFRNCEMNLRMEDQ